MISKKISVKEKASFSLKQKWSSECLITTLLVTLLTIVGGFVNYNKDKYNNSFKSIHTLVISTNANDKGVSEVDNKITTTTFNESVDPVSINRRSFILKQSLNSIFGTITPTINNTPAFTIIPVSPLLSTTDYPVSINKGVKYSNENSIDNYYILNFASQPLVTFSSNLIDEATTMTEPTIE